MTPPLATPTTMTGYRLLWMSRYFPCHDHRFPPVDGPFSEHDYWLGAAGSYAHMSEAVRLP